VLERYVNHNTDGGCSESEGGIILTGSCARPDPIRHAPAGR